MRNAVVMLAVAMMVPAPAQAMSVADFLAKAAILKARGMGALFAPELKQVKAEIQSVSSAYRSDLATQRAAGKPPHSCPPPKGKAKFTSEEIMGEFQAVPPAQRGTTSVKQVFYAMMKKRFPCT